jgi:phage terminase small subunit
MTPKQTRFVAEYLVDLNATQAAIRAGYSESTAGAIGAENLTKPEIAAAVARARNEQAERTAITADEVLRQWWEIATADPNELMHYRRVCCRYCYGKGHAYQWRDEAEWLRVLERETADATREDRAPRIPDSAGGFGFNPTKDPAKACPQCFGEGSGETFTVDTRKASGPARRLFAGVKQTRDGLEIKMRDQDAALLNVAKHLGMMAERVQHTGADGGPIKHEHAAALTDDQLAAIAAAGKAP